MAALLRHAPMRALRRSPGLSALMIATLAFGLAVWLTTYAVAESFAQDPMRHVANLYRVELVRHTEIREILRGTDMGFVAELPSLVLSPGEVDELSRTGIPSRAAAVTSGELPLDAPNEPPQLAGARFADRAAFELFGIRLAAGRVFDDGKRELLISDLDARRWFGSSGQALGKPLRVAGEDWRVAGVVAAGAAVGRRMHRSDDAADPDLWMPFPDAVRLGVLAFSRHPAARGDFDFASLWVELPGDAAAGRFREWLAHWAAAHPNAGLPRVRRYQEWSGVLGAPPPYRVFELFGAVTLAACCLTLSRLFSTRNRLHLRDIALRRALGASRISLLGDALAEGFVIVAAGIVTSILLGMGALRLLGIALPFLSNSAGIGPSTLVAGGTIGLIVGLGAALLPAWRASAEPPARGLKAAA